MTGTSLGRYQLLAEVGAGAMGVVYRARDHALGRDVAVKLLPDEVTDDPDRLRRFAQEARAAAALSHPNILAVYDVGEHEGRPFIVTELLEGESLRQRLGGGTVTARTAVEIAAQIARGLAAAHDKGIVHRDLKPDNVFITVDGTVKLLDFGLAKLTECRSPTAPATAGGSSVTATGVAVGTIGYMAPEQVRCQEVDARTDIFALGCVLHEMLSGRRPFQRTTAADTIAAILDSDPPPLSRADQDVRAPLEALVMRCLAKRPDDRFSSAHDLALALQAVASDAGVRGGRAGTAGRAARRCRWAAALAALAAAVAITVWLLPSRRGRNTILLTELANKTDLAILGPTLSRGLEVKLAESPFLEIAEGGAVAKAMRLMERDPGEPVTAELGRELCRRMGLPALATGEVSALGSRVVVTLRVETCGSGRLLAGAQAEAAGADEALGALDRATAELRGELGESLATLARFDTPLEKATTASLPALEAYTQGMRAARARQHRKAVPHFERALDIDPSFAAAWHGLSAALGNSGQYSRGTLALAEAFRLRGRASELERLRIELSYWRSQDDLEETTRITEQWVDLYPRDSEAWDRLGGLRVRMGRLDEALEARLAADRLDPEYDQNNLGWVLHLMGRLDDAERAYRRAIAERPDDWMPRCNLYDLSFVTGNRRGMEEQLLWAAGRPEETLLLRWAAMAAAVEGRLTASRETFERARDAADRFSSCDLVVDAHVWQAVAEALLGQHDRALAHIRSARALPCADYTTEGDAGWILALAGDTEGAEAIATRLERERPHGPIGAIRALVALERGEADRAVAILRSARSLVPYGLVPWVRGMALRTAGRPHEAAAELQGWLEKPQSLTSGPIWPLALAELARSREQAGDREGAVDSWEELLGLWRQADADLPLLREANAARARLRAEPARR